MGTLISKAAGTSEIGAGEGLPARCGKDLLLAQSESNSAGTRNTEGGLVELRAAVWWVVALPAGGPRLLIQHTRATQTDLKARP